jgi:hypothetical protein
MLHGMDIPEAVGAKAHAAGAAGWLDALPALIRDLEQEWSITTGRVYGDGTEAFVSEATVDGCVPAVLKIVSGAGTRSSPRPRSGCGGRRVASHHDERAVLVHGDVHEWNALQAGDGFALVDPDGLLAEPEYDLAIIMREDPVELMQRDPRERPRWLARRTGLDPTATWEWGVVERVSTGLLPTRIGLQPIGRQMLTAADRIARDCPS